MRDTLTKGLAAALLAATVTLTIPAEAASNTFIKIDGVAGASTDAKHKGEVDALSWSWGQQNPGAARGGAAKPVLQDLVIQKHVDSASAKLLELLHTGKRVATVVLVVEQSGGKGAEMMRIVLHNVAISSIQQNSGQDAPMEQVSLSFTSYEFSTTNPSGKGSSSTSYDPK